MLDRWSEDEDFGRISICATCKHKWSGSAKCWAFPLGIPEAILNGEIGHAAPRRDLGQRNDLVFEERQPGEPEPTMS